VAGGIRRPWIPVINKSHAVPHKNFRLDGHAFADKGVARYFAALANLRAFLHFNEWADLCFIADLAAIQIYERVNPDITPKLYIWRDDLVRVWFATHLANASASRSSSALAGPGASAAPFELENVTGAPFILREAEAASRILIISSP